MDSILKSLFYHWSYIHLERDALVTKLDGYDRAEYDLNQAEAALEETMTPEQKRLLKRYTEAHTATLNLCANASYLTGANLTMRLLLAVLTP